VIRKAVEFAKRLEGGDSSPLSQGAGKPQSRQVSSSPKKKRR
jgi:hypothetical protein